MRLISQIEFPSFLYPCAQKIQNPWLIYIHLVHEIYDQGGYDLRLDYSRQLVPNLSVQDAAWVDKVLREQGLRLG
ncbi:hypothetical protein NIES4071_00580 [Calothrix sp. NIES-4071]|nr:hypothetical protein NIES4071_00580 [Calothrix sp. NIES-4071]BAZ54404.1 hypothetical protein NIES4105_00570 [Calothrix sp. NIES-4105]